MAFKRLWLPITRVEKTPAMVGLLMSCSDDREMYQTAMHVSRLEADEFTRRLADKHFIQRLLYWTGGDVDMTCEMFDRSKRGREEVKTQEEVESIYALMTENRAKFKKWPDDGMTDSELWALYLDMLDAYFKIFWADRNWYDPEKDAEKIDKAYDKYLDKVGKAKADYDAKCGAAVRVYEEAIQRNTSEEAKAAAEAEKASAIADASKVLADAKKQAKDSLDSDVRTAKLALAGYGQNPITQENLKYDITDHHDEYVKFILTVVKFAYTYVQDESEIGHATPLRFFDPSQGIYAFDVDKIDQILRALTGLYTKTNFENFKDYFMTAARRFAPRLRQQDSDGRYLVVRNGILDMEALKLIDFTPEIVLTSRALVTWKGAVEEPTYGNPVYGPNHNQKWSFTTFLKEKANGDLDKYKLLWQIVRAGITGDTKTRKMVLLVDDPDDGHTGKSTFEDVLQSVVGKRYTASLKITQMNDANRRAALVDKKLVIGDDVEAEDAIKAVGAIKPIVSGDLIDVKILYKDVFSIRPQCFCLQSINGRPTFDHIDGPTIDRLCVVLFSGTAQYDIDSDDSKAVKLGAYGKKPFIQEEDFKSWLLYAALTKPEAQGALIQTDESKKELAVMRKAGDPFKVFIEDYMPQLTSDTLPTGFLYDYFCCTMLMEGREVKVSKPRFVSTLLTYHEFSDQFELKKDIAYMADKRPFQPSDGKELLDLFNSTRWGKDLKTFFPMMQESIKEEKDGVERHISRRIFDEERMIAKLDGHGQCFVRKEPLHDLTGIKPVNFKDGWKKVNPQ